jgi:hypothetical protein
MRDNRYKPNIGWARLKINKGFMRTFLEVRDQKPKAPININIEEPENELHLNGWLLTTLCKQSTIGCHWDRTTEYFPHKKMSLLPTYSKKGTVG